MNPNFERLKKLLSHMDSGNLSVDKFDFRTFHIESGCGTAGCMAGELPTLFPTKWTWVEDKYHVRYPKLKRSIWKNPENFNDYVKKNLSSFFGLKTREVERLFFFMLPGSVLDMYASGYKVTENLRDFIAEKKRKSKLNKS